MSLPNWNRRHRKFPRGQWLLRMRFLYRTKQSFLRKKGPSSLNVGRRSDRRQLRKSTCTNYCHQNSPTLLERRNLTSVSSVWSDTERGVSTRVIISSAHTRIFIWILRFDLFFERLWSPISGLRARMQPSLFPFGSILGNPFLFNGDLRKWGFERYGVFFLLPILLSQGGAMDLSKVGEKILSSVKSARSLGHLPSTSDRPEVRSSRTAHNLMWLCPVPILITDQLQVQFGNFARNLHFTD